MEDSLSASSTISCRHDLARECLLARSAFDPIVATLETNALTELLRSASADVTLRFFQTGHELTREDVHFARECLSQ
jgi:predicted esterase